MSRQALNFAARIIRRHRISIGSLRRKLNPGQQALLVLVCLRRGETFASLAAGFGVGTATAWRYVEETVARLAARAPRLRKAVRDAARAGHSYVVPDETLIPIDRVAADRPLYSCKNKKHGMNLQVIAGPRGDILWVSGALPALRQSLGAERGEQVAAQDVLVDLDGLRPRLTVSRGTDRTRQSATGESSAGRGEAGGVSPQRAEDRRAVAAAEQENEPAQVSSRLVLLAGWPSRRSAIRQRWRRSLGRRGWLQLSPCQSAMRFRGSLVRVA